MKALTRIGLLALSVVALTGLGCQSDNEDLVKQQQATATKGAPTEPAKPINNQNEYFKRQQQQQQNAFSKSSGYPGAK